MNRTDVEEKLDQIANVWNDFVWQSKYCSSFIKFTEDVQSNYFGDILNYFKDTFDIIFVERPINSFTDKFIFSISLLQAIYIQQDFIEELLSIFKCHIDKGILKNDFNYSINRDIRNELIGHPIRKTEIPIEESLENSGNVCKKNKKKSVLLSSTLFSYHSGKKTIEYLRYHRDKNYEMELKTYNISDIIDRHTQFLSFYFNKMLSKLKSILEKYDKELDRLQTIIQNQNFETLLKNVEIIYERVFKLSHIYDRESLLKVYSIMEEHRRYRNLINNFYTDLKQSITETKENIYTLFEQKNVEPNPIYEINISIIDDNEITAKDSIEKKREDFHYEIEKLSNRNNSSNFEFASDLLKARCSENYTILNELEHMKKHLHDDIEYYTAFKLICKELKE